MYESYQQSIPRGIWIPTAIFFWATAQLWNGRGPGGTAQALPHGRRRRKLAPLEQSILPDAASRDSSAERFVGRRSPLTWAWPDEMATEQLQPGSPLALAAEGRTT